MRPLAFWMYVSDSLLAGSDVPSRLQRIADLSASRNAELCITGALALVRTNFVQWLEGPPESVAILRESIGRDPRHARIVTLDEGLCGACRFDRWSVVYVGSSGYAVRLIQRAVRERSGPSRHSRRDLIQFLTELSRR